jgi:hypothetical protein
VAGARRLGWFLDHAGLRTIRTWDAAGVLPRPLTIGGKKVWLLREIIDWLRAGAPRRELWERMKSASAK